MTRYRCALCGDFERDEPSKVKKHIGAMKDDTHDVEDTAEYVDEVRTHPTIVELPFDSRLANTEVGGWYRGRVNGVEGYGMFVSLAKRADGTDLSGLAHRSNIAGLYVPSDYEEGQEVVAERLDNDGRDSLALRLVSDPDGELMVDSALGEATLADEPEPADAGQTDPADAEEEEAVGAVPEPPRAEPGGSCEMATGHREPEPVDISEDTIEAEVELYAMWNAIRTAKSSRASKSLFQSAIEAARDGRL